MHTCRVSLRVLLHFFGAEALYLMVCVFQTNSLGSRREGGIIGQKSPAFVDFRQADTENFVRELQASHRETNIQAVRPPDSCCATLVAGAPWRYARPPSSPDPTCGNRESGWNSFTFQEKPICMLNF